MRLSIIVPIYKGVKKLSKFLEQLSVQTSNEYELILIIDSLKEDALMEVDFYLDKFEAIKKNFKLVFNSKRTGRTAAIHEGIALATGDYTLIMSNTDIFNKLMVANAIQIATAHKSDIIEFNASIKAPIKFEGKVRKVYGPESLISENIDAFAFTYAFDFNKLYRTEILKKGSQFVFTSPVNSRYSIELIFKALVVAQTYSSIDKELVVYKTGISENFNPLKQIRQWKSSLVFINKTLESKYYSEWVYNFLFTQTQFTLKVVEKAKSKILLAKYLAELSSEAALLNLRANPYLIQKTEEALMIGQALKDQHVAN